MFDQILPRQIDNTYRGHKAALWVFGVIVFMKTAMSLEFHLQRPLRSDFGRRHPARQLHARRARRRS
jgi:hypothetical protein